MPDKYQIRYTRRVAEQLEQIHDYIAVDSPQSAAHMIERIVDAIDSLDILPFRYSIVRNTELLGTDVRSMPVRPYLIRYHANESERVVTILSVRHGARQEGL